MRCGWLSESGVVVETLVIGVGNAFRGDDGVGLIVAQKLRALTLPGVTVLEQSGEGTALLEAWGDAGRVIVIAGCRGHDLPDGPV